MLVSKILLRTYPIGLSKRLRFMFVKICSPSHVILFGTLCLLVASFFHNFYNVPLRHRRCPSSYWVESLDNGFEGFDNETGVSKGPYIVPNYIHFLRYSTKLIDVSFMDAVCILAAFKNQKPDKIFFHTNLPKFEGKFWDRLMKVPGFAQAIEFQYIEPLESIFGQPLCSRYKLWHSSDLLRIDILRRFGGIFIDNDVYLVKSMDQFRRFEMTVELPDEKSFGTMTLVAHRDARFLRLWLESYREYYGHLWYYNAGEKPKLEVLDARPELVHSVYDTFGVRDLRRKLYTQKWKHWKSQYTIHTLVRHLENLNELTHGQKKIKYPHTFDESNILQYNITLLDMVLDCCSELLKNLTDYIVQKMTAPLPPLHSPPNLSDDFTTSIEVTE